MICLPDLVVIGKANGSISSRHAILAFIQLMGSNLIDSCTSSEINETENKLNRTRLQRGQSVYHAVEICDGKVLSSGSGADKCDLFSNACLRLRMFRNCMEIPCQSLGRGIIASGKKRAVFDILVSSAPRVHQVTNTI